MSHAEYRKSLQDLQKVHKTAWDMYTSQAWYWKYNHATVKKHYMDTERAINTLSDALLQCDENSAYYPFDVKLDYLFACNHMYKFISTAGIQLTMKKCEPIDN